MNQFGFKADQKITDVFQNNRFTLSAEIIPPRNGAEQERVLEQVHKLVEAGSQFLSVTKGAGGSLRGGSLPVAQLVKEKLGVPCIAHFTCRDLIPQEVENSLMDHHYFGIRNILALRGDPPHNQSRWNPREGSYSYAYHLCEQIQKLNQGIYLPRPGGAPVESQEKTDFCVGVACYPEHSNEEERWQFLKKKVDAGAEFAISQMVFDPEAYAQYLDLISKKQTSIPILPGTRILKNQKQARKMEEMFHVKVSSSLMKALPEDETQDDPKRTADLFLTFVEKLRSYGAPGIHLFVLFDTKRSCDVLKQLRDVTMELKD